MPNDDQKKPSSGSSPPDPKQDAPPREVKKAEINDPKHKAEPREIREGRERK